LRCAQAGPDTHVKLKKNKVLTANDDEDEFNNQFEENPLKDLIEIGG
jgi:hypothetical protein